MTTYLEYAHPGTTGWAIAVPALVAGYLASNHGAAYLNRDRSQG